MRPFVREDLQDVLRAHLLELLALPKDAFASVQVRDAPALAVQFCGNLADGSLWFDLPAVWLTPLQLPIMYEVGQHYGVECVDPEDDELPPVFVRDFHDDLELAVSLARDVFALVYEVGDRASMLTIFDVPEVALAHIGASA
jgi:hypothetical protein